MIRKGDVLRIRSEWCEKEERRVQCVALEDEDKSSVLIELQMGWHQFNPTERVETYMVEPWKEEE